MAADPSPDVLLRTHQFAETALDEVTKRAEADGLDASLLHVAFAIASIGWLANRHGPERARDLLDQLRAQVEALGRQSGFTDA
jgi:hypothetical protein